MTSDSPLDTPPTAWRGLLPAQGPPRLADCLRGGLGALLGILVTGLVGRLALGSTGDLPWIAAPMGASAVLVYAVPGSPLAQPWSVVAGNVSSALVGLAVAVLIGPAPPVPTPERAVDAAARFGLDAADLIAVLHRLLMEGRTP